MSVPPGHSEHTRTGVFRSSYATASEKSRTNAFPAEYVAYVGVGVYPPIDATFRM